MWLIYIVPVAVTANPFQTVRVNVVRDRPVTAEAPSDERGVPLRLEPIQTLALN